MKAWITGLAAAAAILASAVMTTAPAEARVVVSVGVPGFYYGPGYYPPGPCDSYNYYYTGDCGYSVYSGPIYIGGAYVTGPHYYRWWGGRPYFWYRGGWHNWAGWNRVHWNWNRGPGWGWRNGRWNRAWGGRAVIRGDRWHGRGVVRGERRRDRAVRVRGERRRHR